MNDRPLIQVEDVAFSYGGTPRILEDVSFTVAEHDFVCMLGPNGGGKTTLLKLLLGLLVPDAGTVRVFGESPVLARPAIGYMPQHERLDPQFPVSVMDVVLMGCLGGGRLFGPYRRADKEAAGTALDNVGLFGVRDKPFATLSGGQRQRTLIARALACRPRLLLLDEPTAHLDPSVQDDFYRLLHEMNERLTLILVSHDVGFVSQYVKTVVCVNRRVVVHPTSKITGEVIRDIYGGDMDMVMHDHGHAHEH
ncbi:MAG: ATP-binding cassette domain-containing protein [Planctomycetota bacterium]